MVMFSVHPFVCVTWTVLPFVATMVGPGKVPLKPTIGVSAPLDFICTAPDLTVIAYESSVDVDDVGVRVAGIGRGRAKLAVELLVLPLHELPPDRVYSLLLSFEPKVPCCSPQAAHTAVTAQSQFKRVLI